MIINIDAIANQKKTSLVGSVLGFLSSLSRTKSEHSETNCALFLVVEMNHIYVLEIFWKCLDHYPDQHRNLVVSWATHIYISLFASPPPKKIMKVYVQHFKWILWADNYCFISLMQFVLLAGRYCIFYVIGHIVVFFICMYHSIYVCVGLRIYVPVLLLVFVQHFMLQFS